MKQGLNNDKIQRANRCLVLRFLLEDRIISRLELAKKTGLKKPTITNIINEFLSLGIVKEDGYIKKGDARKTEALRLEVPNARIISIRIISKFYLIGIFDIHGEIKEEYKYDLSNISDAEELVGNINSKIEKIVSRIEEQNIFGLCIGLPGPYVRKGDKKIAIVTGFEYLSKVNIYERFKKDYKFPIFTEHDAKLSAYAEWKNLKTTKQDTDYILVGIQTKRVGVGAGIVINGKIIEGAYGIAGEIGHMGINFNETEVEYGNKGAYEQYSSSEAVKKYVLERSYEFPKSVINAKSEYTDIVRAYMDGDPLAKCAMDKLAWMVGYGVANIIYTLNPNTIIIDSDYPKYIPFLNKIKDAVAQRVHPDIYEDVIIRFSDLTKDSCLLGGYNLVIENILQDQEIFEYIKSINKNNAD